MSFLLFSVCLVYFEIGSHVALLTLQMLGLRLYATIHAFVLVFDSSLLAN